MLVVQHFALFRHPPRRINVRKRRYLRSSHISQTGNFPINVRKFLRGQCGYIGTNCRVDQIFSLFVLVEFAFYRFNLAIIFKLLDYLRESNRCRTICVFYVTSSYKLFLVFLVIIKIDEIQQLIKCGLSYIWLAADFCQDI